MTDSEGNIEALEEQFPPLSGVAFRAARKQVLDAGLSVLQSEGGAIYEVFPDGSRKRVKDIEPPTQVIAGQKVTVR